MTLRYRLENSIRKTPYSERPLLCPLRPFNNRCLRSSRGVAATTMGGRNDCGTDWQRSSVGCVSPARTGDRVRSAHRLVGPGRCQNKMRHDVSPLVREDSFLWPEKSPPAAPIRVTGSAGGALRGGLYGGAEYFLMRDRRLTQAARVEDTPECRVGFPILEIRS